MGSNAWFSGDKSTLDKCSAVSYRPEMEKTSKLVLIHVLIVFGLPSLTLGEISCLRVPCICNIT